MPDVDVNLAKAVSGEGLQLFKQNLDKKYVKTVNGVAVDPATGAVVVGPEAIAYGDNSNIKAALDALNDKVNYVPIQINSLSNDVNTVEKGTKVRTVNVSWALNNAKLASAQLNKVDLTADELKAGKKTFTYPAPAEGSKDPDPALVADTTFTLNVTDDHEGTATKTTGVYFKNKKILGCW